MQRRQVDLVDGGVALAGGDPVVGIVLGGDDADAVGRAGGGAERAADALLEPGVLELVELVAASEARIDRRLLLRVLDRHRPLDDPGHGRLQPAQGLAERPIGALDAARLGPALDADDRVVGQVRVLAGAASFHRSHLTGSADRGVSGSGRRRAPRAPARGGRRARRRARSASRVRDGREDPLVRVDRRAALARASCSRSRGRPRSSPTAAG